MPLPHKPTKYQREEVIQLAAMGLTLGKIAAKIDVSVSTLKKCYETELAMGKSTDGDIEKLYDAPDMGEVKEHLIEVAKQKQGVYDVEGDFENPLDFLKSIWQNPSVPLAQRQAAATAALPYTNGKIAEKGKKQTRIENAKAAAIGQTGGQQSGNKFAEALHQLKVIGGKDVG